MMSIYPPRIAFSSFEKAILSMTVSKRASRVRRSRTSRNLTRVENKTNSSHSPLSHFPNFLILCIESCVILRNICAGWVDPREVGQNKQAREQTTTRSAFCRDRKKEQKKERDWETAIKRKSKSKILTEIDYGYAESLFWLFSTILTDLKKMLMDCRMDRHAL